MPAARAKAPRRKPTAPSPKPLAQRPKPSAPSPTLTAAAFEKALRARRSDAELKKIQRYFKSGEGDPGAGDTFLGVRMGDVFALAKEHRAMPLAEIEKLLESPIHEVRAGGVSLMGKSYADRKASDERRAELYALALRRTDRINNWDLVDLAGLYVVGPHLIDRPRAVLSKLARSKDVWERRLAIVSTGPLIRAGELDDTYRMATMLLSDKEDLIHKATGWMLRAAGDADKKRLLAFLDANAASMPRTLLRYAIEKLSKAEKARYMAK